MEKTSNTSENKEKSRDGYVNMYKCRKYFYHSTYERVYIAKDLFISKMEELVEK